MKRSSIHGKPIIEGSDLDLNKIPDPSASMEEIWTFALTFDAYELHGSFEACSSIANERRHDSLDDLRTCLFFEQRKHRNDEQSPYYKGESQDEIDYVTELVRLIREKVSTANKTKAKRTRSMKSKQSIIYVMRHIDIGGHIDIPYKKVGITGKGSATLDSRLQQISNTKSPIKAQCVAAWEYADAKKLEDALHLLLEDNRVEGEWFYDKEDSLVDRMHPIMELIGAEEIQIKESDDVYTKSIMQKENSAREQSDHVLLGEIAGLLKQPFRSSSRKTGPTFFSDKKELTYYVNARKSGNHNLAIGRSKGVYKELSTFLEEKGFDVEQGKKGIAIIHGITSEVVVDVIELIEAEFEAA